MIEQLIKKVLDDLCAEDYGDTMSWPESFQDSFCQALLRDMPQEIYEETMAEALAGYWMESQPMLTERDLELLKTYGADGSKYAIRAYILSGRLQEMIDDYLCNESDETELNRELDYQQRRRDVA